MFVFPSAPTRRCRACKRPVMKSALVDGLGPECAAERGLVPAAGRVRRWNQEGDDLLTEINERNDVSRFRKKPVEVEAIRFDGANADEVVAFMGGPRQAKGQLKKLPGPGRGMHDGIAIETLEGTMTASVGDWIICGVRGEHYPCKPDIFEATYEPVGTPGVTAPWRAFIGEKPCSDPSCACHGPEVTS